MKKAFRGLALSICIPTYNRARVLDRLLEGLSQEIAGLESEVEICISDNASQDETGQIAKKWAARLPIKYRKSKRNLGLDINFVKITELASGRFIWYSGDDDLFLPGSVQRLLDDLKRPEAGKAGAVYLNATSKRGPMAFFGFGDFRLFKKGSGDYPPLNISFAGSLCLRRDVAREIIRDKIRFSGTKLVKKEEDPHLLDYFSPAYLFLECASAAGWFGIEPCPAIEIVADGSVVSYERKFYLDLILTAYPLEMRRAYPWFRDGARNYNIKSLLVGAAMAASRPELEEAYALSRGCYLRILEMDGSPAKARLLSLFDPIRKNAVGRAGLVLCFKAARRILGLRIKDEPATDAYSLGNLKFGMARARGILGANRKAPDKQ